MIKNIKLRLLPSLRVRLNGIKGVIETRNSNGDWSPYFGTYESQKKDWFDTNSCWAYAGNEVLEDQLEFLMKTGGFADYEIQWFKDKGYIDADGDFYLSRRFVPTLSGVTTNGNDPAEFWRLTKKYGAIPSSMLPFTAVTDYFDRTKITQDMYDLGAEFIQRVSIDHKELGNRFSGYKLSDLKSALQETELQIGIPVPQDGRWNQVNVPIPNHTDPDHEVALYKIDEISDPEYPYFIYDQYAPMRKQLHKDYFIPLCTVATVSSGMLGPKLTVSVWTKVAMLLKDLMLIK